MAVSTITAKALASKAATDSSAKSSDNDQAQQSDVANDPKTTKKGRVVVTGSSLFAANRFFKLQGNGDLFLNSISWLAEDENLIAIRPKSENAQPIVSTGNQSLVSFIIPVIIVPLIWIIAGVAVFVYRRKLARAGGLD